MSELIRYESQDGCEHCLHMFAGDDPTAPVVLLFPAMGTPSPFYFDLAPAFAEQGLQFACTDLRGHGPMHAAASWSNDFGYHEMLSQDWPAALKAVRQRLPEAPVFLMGHSLGGQLNACFASLLTPKEVEPEGELPVIRGLILVASGNVHYKGYGNPYRVLWGAALLKWISRIVGHMPGKWLGFAGREARGVIRDWQYTAKTGRYRIRQGKKFTNLDGKLSQMQTPIMAITFDGDKYAPHRAMQNLLDKTHLADKRHWKTSARDLKVKKLSHFSWVKQAEVLTPKLAEWIGFTLNRESRVRRVQP